MPCKKRIAEQPSRTLPRMPDTARKGFEAYDEIGRNGRKRSSVAQTLYDAIKYAVLLGAALTVLQIYHVNVASLVAGLGIASAIVGLALQDVLKDTIMGICNRNISEVVRCSDWVDVDIPLPYEESVGRVYNVLEDICRQIEAVEGIERCECKGTQAFADSAVVYKVRFYCAPEHRPELRRKALRVIRGAGEGAYHHPLPPGGYSPAPAGLINIKPAGTFVSAGFAFQGLLRFFW